MLLASGSVKFHEGVCSQPISFSGDFSMPICRPHTGALHAEYCAWAILKQTSSKLCKAGGIISLEMLVDSCEGSCNSHGIILIQRRYQKLGY